MQGLGQRGAQSRATQDMGEAIEETQVAERDKRSLETEGSEDPDGE